MLLHNKEPVFSIYNYLLYYLTFGSTYLYIVITTIVAYLFLFFAIYNYYKIINYNKNIIVFSVIIVAFLPQLFGLSAHIVRQFLGSSILFYGIVNKVFYKKSAWAYLLTSIFIHSSTLLFVPMLYIGNLRSRIKLKTLLTIAIIVTITCVSLQKFAELIPDMFGENLITYAFIRASKVTTHDLNELSLAAFIMMGVLLLVSFWYQYGKSCEYNKSLAHFMNIYFILCIFILSNIRMTEMAARFFFYVYFFTAFIFPLIFLRENKIIIFLRQVIAIGVILFFIYRLQYGPWRYASASILLINPTLPLLGI